MAMIGPFPRRTLLRIAGVAITAAALLGLANTNVPTSTRGGIGLAPDGRYVIDPDANGPIIGSTLQIPFAQPAASGGVYGDLIAARSAAGLVPARLIIIDFFATWCPPCQQETPTLRSLDRAYRAAGLLIIGVSVQELPPTVRSYADRYNLEYPILLDTDGSLFRAATAGGLPTKIMLDAEGRVLAVIPRPFTPQDGAALIEPLLTTP